MNKKVAAARALGAHLTRQALRLATIFFVSIVAILLLVIGLLAYNFTAWWWVFAIPIIIACLIALVLHWLVRRLASLIYRHPFSRAQRQALNEFTDKVRSLIDAKNTPLPILAIITIKDVLIHKDPRTIRQLIDNSTSLKADLKDLEKHFGER